MNLSLKTCSFFLLLCLLNGSFNIVMGQKPNDNNFECLKCHAHRIYKYHNTDLDIDVKKSMCSNRIIDTTAYLQSNHGTFSCTDCHSYDYTTFPHPGSLRMEAMILCIDCHGGDPEYSQFHFELIEEAFYQSMHYNRAPNVFTCWSCHNPHSYKTMARYGKNIKKTVMYDNNICLSCHANISKYELLTEREDINILKSHDWLPNQELHFKNVRCIECHTPLNDSLLISHAVMPKENAIRECTSCHSKNSHLMASLYKFKSLESRKNSGFLNAVILNESYVIGANRNKYLNILSVILFAMATIGIITHAILRILKRK